MSSFPPATPAPGPAATPAWLVVLDLLCLTALLGTAYVPLVALRGSPRLHESSFLAGILAPGAFVCLAWFSLRRRFGAPNAASADAAERLPLGRRLAVATLLLLLTVVCFSLPLRKQFWGGVDDVASFSPHFAVWSDEWDTFGRPLLGLSAAVGSALTPGRITGYLWLASALCFANSLLLWGVLRRLFRGAEWPGVAAAVLLICHRGDDLRFMVLWAANFYCTAVFLLLLAFWLFLVSYDRRSRWMLVLACCALGASLLSYEAGYPLALLGPLCLWLSRRKNRDVGVWSFGWLGTITLTALRFAHYLTTRGHSSYQLQYFSGPLHRPELLAANLLVLLKPILLYFKPWDHAGTFLLPAAAAGAAAALACLLCRGGGEPSRRRMFVGVGVAAVGVLLGLAPFLPIGTTFRTQFYAAPAEAAGIALSLACCCAFAGRRIGPVFLTAVIALLAGHSALESQISQARARRPICFEKTVHIFQQIHALSPTLPDGALVLLIGEEGAESPLGVSYHVPQLSQAVLGRWVLQVGCVKSAESGVAFSADAVIARMEGVGLDARFPYDRVIAFRLDGDGAVSLLRRLPASLAPSPEAALRYDPLALFNPGPLSELPYLRYSPWMRPPLDVVSPSDGLVLGEGWGPLRFGDGRLSRVVEQGAEIVVNPMGAASREVRLQLQPMVEAGASSRLTLLDEDGRTAAVAPVEESGIVRATVAVNPAHVALFRMRLEVTDRPCGPFRVFAPGGPWSSNPNPACAHSAAELARR